MEVTKDVVVELSQIKLNKTNEKVLYNAFADFCGKAEVPVELFDMLRITRVDVSSTKFVITVTVDKKNFGDVIAIISSCSEAVFDFMVNTLVINEGKIKKVEFIFSIDKAEMGDLQFL